LYEKGLDKLDEKGFFEKEITEEFTKEMAYYNWLMDRKYLLLKSNYDYYDFLEFMSIQEYMLKYY
jgi:hypothetical protein